MADPMNSPDDLAQIDQSDPSADPDGDPSMDAGQGQNGKPPDVVVCIRITPDGQISVFDGSGAVQPQPAKDLNDALKSAGELATELSQRSAATAMKARQMQRPGNEDAQSIWDQMAAQRQPRGNT
jgi:hypothetical protein